MSERKNFRGFTRRCYRILFDLVTTEFKTVASTIPIKGGGSIDAIGVILCENEKDPDVVARVEHYQVNPEGEITRFLLNITNPEKRALWLAATDDDIKGIFRHELLHVETKLQDTDVQFTMECLKRRIGVNEDALEKFEATYGSGSAAFFARFLPEGKRS